MRVVSLLPAATACCFALGVEPVGVSAACDHPPATREIPTVSTTRVDASASSETINEQVAEANAAGGVYDLDHERLRALDPDVVIAQDRCGVCAVDEDTVEGVLRTLDIDATVLTVDPGSLAELFETLHRLGEVLDRSTHAQAVTERLRDRVNRVESATPDTTPSHPGPKVAILDWMNPMMIAGHWIPGMVERIGARYGLAEPGDPSRPRRIGEIRAYDPEIIVIAPCGFDLEQTIAEYHTLEETDEWASLTAVRDGQVYAIDGSAYVNSPGPRLVDTLSHLAAIVHGVGEFPDDSICRRLPPAQTVED